MHNYVKNLQMAFIEVFSRTSHIVLALALAAIAFAFAVWLPNAGLITEVFSTSEALLAAKLKVAASLLLSVGTNFTLLSAGYMIAIAILFGVNASMIVHLARRSRGGVGRGNLLAGSGGVASGVLGIGCAACGSFLLSTVLSSFGAAGALVFLPLQGGEFGIVSVILLAVSLLIISRKIASSLTCNIT